MEIDKIPLIKRLNEFALELPPEHRSELYRIAENFLCVGVKQGIFVGIPEGIRAGQGRLANPAPKEEEQKGDEQRECMAYLSEKAQECEV